MGRLHLYEFNDQPWLPHAIRVGMTDYLATISRLAKLHEQMTPVLEKALADSGAERIVDLCSGSGGPLLDIYPALSHKVPVLMTDMFPAGAPADTPEWLTYHAESVDALDCELEGLRTLFNAFHHFEPERARRILGSAFERRQPIVIVESTARTVQTVLSCVLLPLFVFLLVPLIRPVRLTTFLFTYLIPILPTLISFDGLVSHLRTYSVEEMSALTAEFSAPDYTWESQRLAIGPGAWLTVLTGTPGPG